MKKRAVIGIFCAVSVFCMMLCGCVSEGEKPAGASGSPETTASNRPQALDFEASYVRAAWDHSEQTHAAVFNSRKEFEDYYNSFQQQSNMYNTEFLGVISHYTDDFFENHSLILARVHAENVSDGYKVQNVSLADEESVRIEIECFLSETDGIEGEYRSIFIGTDKKIGADADIHVIVTPNHSLQPLNFETRGIFAGSHEGNCEYEPALRFFRAHEELEGYSEAEKRYDVAFFENHTLVLMRICEPISSSFQHEVQRVSFVDDGSVLIEMDRFIPEVFSESEGHWNIWVEINKAVSKDTPIEVVIMDTKMEK